MKLEEALVHLREGKKIRHPTFDEGEYLVACHEHLRLDPQVKWLSVIKMLDDKRHPIYSMGYKEFLTRCEAGEKHPSLPKIPILLLVRDDWEVLKEET